MLGMKPKMEDFWLFEGNGVFLILVPKIRVIAGGRWNIRQVMMTVVL
jgi:hypothetical protein